MKRKSVVRAVVTSLALTLAVVFASSLPGCSGCGGSAPTAYVPQDALFVMIVPSLQKAIEQQGKLIAKFKDSTTVSKAWEQVKSEAKKELGFDPYKPEAMKAKGINPASGVVGAMSSNGKNFAAALGVEDQKAMEKFLRGLAKKMVGASANFKTKEMDGVKVTTVTMQGSDKQIVAWGYHKKYVLICPQAEDKEMAKYVVKVTKLEKTIKDNKAFGEIKGKVGSNQMLLYFDGESVKKATEEYYDKRIERAKKYGYEKYIVQKKEAATYALTYFKGGVMGIDVSGKGVQLKTYVGMPGEKGKKFAEFFKGKGGAVDFGEYILPSAVTVARGSVDFKKLFAWLSEMDDKGFKKQYLRSQSRFEKRYDVDVDKDIFELLSGRYAMGFFAPPADAFKGDKRMQEKIAKAAGGVLLVQVTDTAKAADLLATMDKAMTVKGVDIQTRTEGDRKNYFFKMGGERLVGWTAVKKMVVVTSAKHLETTVKLIEKGGDNVLGTMESSDAKSTFKKDDGMIWYVNLNQLATLATKMKVPTEFKMQYKMYVEPASKVLAKFSDTAYVVDVQTDGVLGTLSINLK